MRILLYCRKCDCAPIEAYRDEDGFLRCKDCDELANAVEKDEMEK